MVNEITGDNEDSETLDAELKPKTEEKARLPTGVDVLDRNLNGGVPSGSLIYFGAYPRSMPEVFLYELTVPRKTYYVTTDKEPKHIVRNMAELDFDPSNVHFVDIHDEYYNKLLSGPQDKQAVKKIIQYLNDWLDSLKNTGETNFTIIIDSFSFLLETGTDMDTLKRLLDKIYNIVEEQSSVCYLMMVKGIHPESIECRIEYWCDVIFDIDLERRGDKIVNKLTIPKIRGMTPLTDYIKFKVTDRISIDTSRDIA